MERTRLSTKGQVIIPKSIRDARGWKPGLELSMEIVGEGILLRPVSPFQPTRVEDVLGCAGYEGPARSIEEMEAAIIRGARST